MQTRLAGTSQRVRSSALVWTTALFVGVTFASECKVDAQISSAQFSAEVIGAGPQTYLDFNDATTSFRDQAGDSTFIPSTVGTILPKQLGFDSTQPSNKSASFTYDSFITAADASTDDFEWYQPFSMMMQVDNLQYSGTGTMYFLSKGDVGSIGGPWFSLAMKMNAGTTQLCFTMNGVGGKAQNTIAQPSVCTHPGLNTFANGYNYNLVVTNDGTGSPGALKIYVNGFQPAFPVYGNNSVYRFGAVVLTLDGSGTGYPNSVSFTSVGGGVTCSVSGTLKSTKGVPQSITYSSNWGCTSLPSIQLSAASGAGAILTPVLFGAKMSTAQTYPLTLAGAEFNGAHLGIGGSAASIIPQYIDEFAVFPRVLTLSEIESLFYRTKFYQKLLKPRPATPPSVIFDNDGCADSDNIYALALAIAEHKLGYIVLSGVVDTDGSGPSLAMYRQMLDEAGLQRVPLGVPSSTAVHSSLCTFADIDKVNPDTPQTPTAYEKAATVYRQILAEHTQQPVDIVLAGSFRGLSDLMQSAGDNISPLSGPELLARDATSGGAVFAQGLGCCGEFTGDNSLQDWTAGQYVVSHNGKMPIYWFGGSPQSSGPGILATRPVDDPVSLFAQNLGSDVRQAWDSLPTSSFLTAAFAQGVLITIGGNGRGYADLTAFSSTGGGPLCQVTGTLLSSAGLPTSIQYPGGVYAGLGSGCTSDPTIVLTSPVGTGVSLTATLTSTCGTVVIDSQHAGSTSDANCSQHYFVPDSASAQPGNSAIYTWFLNSLIDPEPAYINSGGATARAPVGARLPTRLLSFQP